MKPSDSVLLEQWMLRRDAEAFAVLVQRYSRLVYATAARILGNRTDAEDVAQECFLALARAEIPGPRSVMAWLHTVATRQSLKRARGDRGRRARELSFVEQRAGSETAEWEDVKALVDEAIEELPEKVRSVVIAHFLNGRTHRNIAREQGVSRQAVSYRVAKGISEVRRQLNEKGVTVPATVLSSFLATKTAEAVPPSLLGDLGRMALAGTDGRNALVAPSSIWVALGTVPVRWIGAALLVPLAASLGWFSLVERGVALDEPVVVAGVSPGSETGPLAPSPEIAPKKPPAPLPQSSTVSPTAFFAEPEAAAIADPIRGFDGAVSGRVVDTAFRRPLEVVRVTAQYLETHLSEAGVVSKTGHVLRETTNSDGEFRFENMKRARYEIWAETDGVVPVRGSVEVDLRAVRERNGIQVTLGIQPLGKGGIVEGIVTVGDEAVENKTVSILYPTHREVRDRSVRMADKLSLTDASGHYRVTGLPAGDVEITVTGPIGESFTQYIEVVSGQTESVNFHFPESANSAIEGWVTPLPVGAVVRVRAYIDNADGYSLRRIANTDADGRYSFQNLPSGQWELVATPAQIGGAVDRVSVGSWTLRSIDLWFLHDETTGFQGTGQFTHTYYSSLGEALAATSSAQYDDSVYDTGWVFTETGTTARLDFDLSGLLSVRGILANLAPHETADVLLLEDASPKLSPVTGDSFADLEKQYVSRRTVAGPDGSFHFEDPGVSDWSFQRDDIGQIEVPRFTVVVLSSAGRSAYARASPSHTFMAGKPVATFFSRHLVLDLD